MTEGIAYRYPADYGTKQCAAWDEFLQPFCANNHYDAFSDAPDYCGQSWCYVNIETCPSGTLTDYFPGSELYYSYIDACGATEDFDDFDIDDIVCT